MGDEPARYDIFTAASLDNDRAHRETSNPAGFERQRSTVEFDLNRLDVWTKRCFHGYVSFSRRDWTGDRADAGHARVERRSPFSG